MRNLLLSVLCCVTSMTVFADSTDKRRILALTEAQRGLVLDEMRGLLSGTRNILAALAVNDMRAVARHARSIGTAMTHKSEEHLKGALPDSFMQLGMSVHRDFDRIAADAESRKSSRHTLRQLSRTMDKCIACHATYQIRVTGNSGPPAR